MYRNWRGRLSGQGLLQFWKDKVVRCAKPRSHTLDKVFVFLLCAVGLITGAAYMFGWMGPAVNPYFTDDYRSALYIGCGQGFVSHPGNVRAPELDAFLRYEKPVLLPKELPETSLSSAGGGFALCHRYLFYTLGAVWRVFGVSWNALRCLLIAFLCITVLLAYGVFRLATRPLLSLALSLAFLFSGGVLHMMSYFRDFSKAPFIFAAVLVMGWIATQRPARRRFLGLAAVLGLIQGVGFGFRQDLQILVPVSAVVLLFCVRDGGIRSIPERLGALAVMIGAFLVPAWPIMHSMAGMPSSFHHLTMGLATIHDDSMGLSRTSYERAYLLHDYFAYAESNSYASRVEGMKVPIGYQSAESAWAEEQFFLENVKTFPGDTLSRAYAATLWAISGASPDLPRFNWPQYDRNNPMLAGIERIRSPLETHLVRYGAYYALAALLIVSFRSVRSAWLLLGIVLYFSGYTSLQFQYRHCFHLAIIPLWFMGFVFQQVWDHARPIGRALRRKGPAIEWRAPLKWALLFALVAAAALYLPLRIARAYQSGQIASLLEQYKHAELDPISTESRVLDPHWTLIHPVSRPPSVLASATQRDVPYRTEYLVAELEAAPERRVMLLRYDTDKSDSLFGRGIVIEPTGAANAGSSFYFFPVYECADPAYGFGYTHFTGIALPNEHVKELKRLYRVTNLDEFRLLLNFSVPADASFLRPYARFLPIEAPLGQEYTSLMYMPSDPQYKRPEIRGKLAAGDAQEAARVAREALASSPLDVELRMAVGDALVAQGNVDEAVAGFRQIVASDPDFLPAYDRLDALFARRGGPEQKAAAWQELADSLPNAGPAYTRLGETLDAAGNVEQSKTAFLKAAELNDTEPEVFARLASSQMKAGDRGGAITSYWRAIGLTPDNGVLRRRFAEMFEKAGDLDTAYQVCLDALIYSTSDPLSPILATLLNQIGDRTKTPSEHVAAWLGVVRLHPAEAMGYNQLGTAMLRAGNKSGAEKAYREALQLEPRSGIYAASLGRILEMRDDLAGAISVYRESFAVAPRDALVCGLLSSALVRQGKDAEAIRVYRKALKQYPENIELWRGMARQQEGLGDVDGALRALRDALSIEPESHGVICSDLDGVLARANDEGRRVAVWRDLASTYPKMEGVWMFLGESQLRANDVNGAIESFSRACALNPNNAAAKAKLEKARNAAGQGAAS